ELQCAIRIFRLSQMLGNSFTWGDGFIVFPIGFLLVLAAFISTRRGPTSGIVALTLGEWIARDLSAALVYGPRPALAITAALRLALLPVTAFVLARIDTKPDDLPRAGLGWAAQPADVILLPWSAGWLVSTIISLRAMIAGSRISADPLSSTSV